MKRWALIVCLAVALAAGGFIAGRTTAPAEVHEHVVEKQVQAKEQEKQRDDSLASDSARYVEKVRIRYVRSPDGTVSRDIERDVAEASDKRTATSATRERKAEIQFVDREVIKIQQAPGQVWALAARAGFREGGARVFGGQVTRQILGPIGIGIWADSTKAAGVIVEVRW